MNPPTVIFQKVEKITSCFFKFYLNVICFIEKNIFEVFLRMALLKVIVLCRKIMKYLKI